MCLILPFDPPSLPECIALFANKKVRKFGETNLQKKKKEQNVKLMQNNKK